MKTALAKIGGFIFGMLAITIGTVLFHHEPPKKKLTPEQDKAETQRLLYESLGLTKDGTKKPPKDPGEGQKR